MPDQDEQTLDLARLGDSSDASVRVRGALLSVHAHVESHQPPLDALLADAIPIPIPRTAAILRDEGELRLRRSRRHRMAIRYVTLAANANAPNWLRSQAEEAASGVLGPDNVKAILKELERRGSRDRQDRGSVEAFVATQVGPTSIDDCEWNPKDVRVTLNRKSIHLNTQPTFKKQTLAKAAQGLDPRSWAHCCKTLWKETRLCEVGPDGEPVMDPDGKCHCLSEDEIPIGGDFGRSRLLYENFICDDACSIELYLDTRVIFPPRSTEYLLHYSNPRMIAGPKVLPDEGRVSVKQASNALFVDCFKKFGYTDYTTAIVIYLVLTRIESSHYLGELVCCTS